MADCPAAAVSVAKSLIGYIKGCLHKESLSWLLSLGFLFSWICLTLFSGSEPYSKSAGSEVRVVLRTRVPKEVGLTEECRRVRYNYSLGVGSITGFVGDSVAWTLGCFKTPN